MFARPAILALLLVSGAPAMAAPTDGDVTKTVRIDDLNLALASDRLTLDARVANAARRLCRSDLRGTAELALRSECIAAAIASAKAQTERAVAGADRGVQLAAR